MARSIDPALKPRMRAVLARLCERAGPLFTTQAVKLPYLVDVIAKKVLGRTIADGTYQAWEHGVVAREVFRFLKHETDTDPLFRVQPHGYSESGMRVSLARPADTEDELSPEEIAIVDFVADEYGPIPPEQLGHVTKRLNTEIAPEKWGSNTRAAVDEEAFLRLGPEWQSMCERIGQEDLLNRALWSEPITDPMAHFLRALDE